MYKRKLNVLCTEFYNIKRQSWLKTCMDENIENNNNITIIKILQAYFSRT